MTSRMSTTRVDGLLGGSTPPYPLNIINQLRFTIMRTIKIAPSSDEVRRVENTLVTDFNGLHIEYEMQKDYYPTENCVMWLCSAIAMSSKTWQIEDALNRVGMIGKLNVKPINA